MEPVRIKTKLSTQDAADLFRQSMRASVNTPRCYGALRVFLEIGMSPTMLWR